MLRPVVIYKKSFANFTFLVIGQISITSFKVFDRWGELLFERKNIQTDDPSVGWDGEFRGVVLSPDVYVYIMEAICETGEPINWKGDIMIMR